MFILIMQHCKINKCSKYKQNKKKLQVEKKRKPRRIELFPWSNDISKEAFKNQLKSKILT